MNGPTEQEPDWRHVAEQEFNIATDYMNERDEARARVAALEQQIAAIGVLRDEWTHHPAPLLALGAILAWHTSPLTAGVVDNPTEPGSAMKRWVLVPGQVEETS